MKRIVSFTMFSMLAALLPACLTQTDGATTASGGTPTGPAVDAGGGTDPGANTTNADVIPYRDLSSHPGCTGDGLSARAAGATNANSYVPAQIPGYKCAAKDYGQKNEDTSKPIVLLVHGNSSTPADFEAFADPNNPSAPTPMLSERLVAAGYKVLAVDGRFDKVDDPNADNKTQNAARNMDHGWYVPLVQHFIDSVMTAYPNREISIVSFSLGPTTVRDALRRLHRAGKKPFERIRTLVYASGANHGVSSYATLCASNPTMRGKVACQMGDRDHYQETDFLKPINGPESVDTKTGHHLGAYETPCADGNTAFGQSGVCGGHKVAYYTIVMMDPPNSTLQDEFVSQGSAALSGATNLTVGLEDIDKSNYFIGSGAPKYGLFKDHYGSIRSENGLTQVMTALAK
jgi:hypothetical protein